MPETLTHTERLDQPSLSAADISPVQEVDARTAEDAPEIYYCDYCSYTTSDKDDMVYYDGSYFCVSCQRVRLLECSDCGEWHRKEDSRHVSDAHICPSCYRENYFTCDGCRCNYHNDDYAEDGLCNNCYHEEEEDDLIIDAGSHPELKFLHSNSESLIQRSDRNYLGVELEVEDKKENRTPHQLAQKLADTFSCFYFQEDGSLDNGLEITTHPCTLLYLQNDIDWQQMSDICRGYGFASHDTTTCGLHVHISRKAFKTEEDELKFAFFIYSHIMECEHFSRRKGERWARYKKAEDGRDMLEVKAQEDKYYAVNFDQPFTIEVRMFKGTLNPSTILASIEFVHSLAMFVRGKPTYLFMNNKKSWSEFCDYIYINRTTYPALNGYMLMKGLHLRTSATDTLTTSGEEK